MKTREEFEKLFITYYRPLCIFALHFTGSSETAEDIVQQLFTDLWETRPVVLQWKPYLYTAVKNRCLKADRAGRRVSIESIPGDIPDEDDEHARQVEREEALWQWIDDLPPARREILLLAKHEQMSYREIARQLRISEKTVENQMGKALKSLREKGKRFYLLFFA